MAKKSKKTPKSGVATQTEFSEPEKIDASESEYEDPEQGNLEAAELVDIDDPKHVRHVEKLVSLKRQICDVMAMETGPSVQALDMDTPLGSRNVVGVGIGRPEVDFESSGTDGPGSAVLNIYVAERAAVDEVKAGIVDEMGVGDLASDEVAINVVPTGFIDVRARHIQKMRPVPCGVSAGHHRITAGTFGVLARGRSGDRRNRLMALSNNHVLANSNDAEPGDTILQPGAADGGTNPADRIGRLERWVPIKVDGQDNWVDCATAWCSPTKVRREFFMQTPTGPRLFRVSPDTVSAQLDLAVGKTGRTTGLTKGRIYDTSADIRVRWEGGVALFRDQIGIVGTRGNFSAGGDSGSLIWTWDNARRPVGLLFAGGGGYTFANKIDRVLDALDIDLVV